MTTIAKKTTRSLFLYLELILGILCYIIVAVTAILMAVACRAEGMEALKDTTNIIIIAIFVVFFLFGGSWLVSRFCIWKKQPSELVCVDEEGNLIIYLSKQVTIAKDEIISVVAAPESLFIKIFGGGFGTIMIQTTSKTYKLLFVDQADTIPDKINQVMRLN
ncbi:MAG: hypothetical protein ACI4MI_01095 [Christensenellales bacterium]